MYKIKINREKCKGCGNCARVCSSNWRVLEDKKAHAVKIRVKKLGCNEKAATECPFKAITISRI